MKSILSTIVFAVAVAFAAIQASHAAYEGPLPRLADRIVARVGSTALTLTEVEEMVTRRRVSDPNAMRKLGLRRMYAEALIDLIDEELLYQGAKEKGVTVPEEMINSRVDEMIRQLSTAFGTEGDLGRALVDQGLTLDRLKNSLRKSEERDLRIARAIASRFTVTDAESQRYEQTLRAEGKPAYAWQLRHILIAIPSGADAATWKRAGDAAFRVGAEIHGGLAFELAAEKYSSDMSTSEKGGMLGYVDEGTMEPAIEAAIRKMKRNEISQPMRSSVGVHIFQLLETRTPRKMLFTDRFNAEKAKWLDELRRTKTIEQMKEFLEQLPE